MKHKLLNNLIDDTLSYLEELKIESPYIVSDILPTESSILPSTPTPTAPPVILAPASPPPTITPPVVFAHKPEPVHISAPSPPQPAFIPHPPKSGHKDPMQDLRAVLSKIAPTLALRDTIPSDAEAKRIKSAWKEQLNVPDIVILATQSPSLPFLHHVAKAIELHFFPSRVIEVKPLEEKNSWEAFLNTPNLKMIIAPDGVVWSSKQLMRHYHEFPNKKERFLGKIPLLLLPDPSLYLKDPTLKRSLWNLLCQMLKPLQR